MFPCFCQYFYACEDCDCETILFDLDVCDSYVIYSSFYVFIFPDPDNFVFFDRFTFMSLKLMCLFVSLFCLFLMVEGLLLMLPWFQSSLLPTIWKHCSVKDRLIFRTIVQLSNLLKWLRLRILLLGIC